MQEFQSLNNVINSNICVEDQWQSFKNSLNFGIEKYIPTSEHTFNNKWSTPLPPCTRNLIKKKHRLWTRYNRIKHSLTRKGTQIENEYKRFAS